MANLGICTSRETNFLVEQLRLQVSAMYNHIEIWYRRMTQPTQFDHGSPVGSTERHMNDSNRYCLSIFRPIRPFSVDAELRDRNEKAIGRRSNETENLEMRTPQIFAPQNLLVDEHTIFQESDRGKNAGAMQVNSKEHRLDKMSRAVEMLLECIGEDLDREGLKATPKRFSNALLYFTQGYQSDLDTIVNNAVFDEDHAEIVLVKDIDVHSLCEHHLVPFTGKVIFYETFSVKC